MSSRNKRDKKKYPKPEYHRVVVRDSRHDPPDAHKLAELIVSLAESLTTDGDETKLPTDIGPSETRPAAA